MTREAGNARRRGADGGADGSATMAARKQEKKPATRTRADSALAAAGTFHNPALLRQALTHRSWKAAGSATAAEEPDYERLEFLGDAVLGLRVSERLLQAFPESPEGELSRLRSWLVSARHLAQVARALRLGEHLRLSPGEERLGGRNRERLLANAMEAVIGAIHVDRGYAAAARFVDRRVLGTTLAELSPGQLHEFAYKSALQEWAHAHHCPPPAYRVVGSSGPEHGKTFQVELRLAGVYTGRAQGRSKKAAEQEAARAALVHLGAIAY